MKMLQKCHGWSACAAVLLIGNLAQATPFVPASVSPGSAYHLVFVTRDARDALSPLISTYNTFVNTQAALNPTLTGTSVGVQYRVIGSTTTDSALSNAPISAPVYNFNGTMIAAGSADMWDGSILAPIEFDQFATSGFPDMWTGTDVSGNAEAGFELGAGGGNARTGLSLSGVTDFRWVDDSNFGTSQDNRFYALSQVLIAPDGSVPEPSTLLLLGLGALGLVRHSHRHRGKSRRNALA